MIELEVYGYGRAAQVLTGLRHFVHLSAVLDGHHPGRVFVDDVTTPSIALVWTRWGFFYLAGASDNYAANRAVNELLSDQLIPASVALGERDLVLYPFPRGWEGKLDVILGKRTPTMLYRRAFEFNPLAFAAHHGWAQRVPPGFRMQQMDSGLALEFSDKLITWKSIADFLSRGFGFCLLHNAQVVSNCFSVFVSGDRVEISISTAEAYRRRGFALLTVSAFIEYCLENGFRPNWECWRDNAPSCALAGKLGYDSPTDYPAYYWHEGD